MDEGEGHGSLKPHPKLFLFYNSYLKEIWQKGTIWQSSFVGAWMSFWICSTFLYSWDISSQDREKVKAKQKVKFFCSIYIFAIFLGNNYAIEWRNVDVFLWWDFSLNVELPSLNVEFSTSDFEFPSCARCGIALTPETYSSPSPPKFLDQDMKLLQGDVRKYDLVTCLKSKLSVRSTKHNTQGLSERKSENCCFSRLWFWNFVCLCMHSVPVKTRPPATVLISGERQ